MHEICISAKTNKSKSEIWLIMCENKEEQEQDLADHGLQNISKLSNIKKLEGTLIFKEVAPKSIKETMCLVHQIIKEIICTTHPLKDIICKGWT